jgi:hypothetical protein
LQKKLFHLIVGSQLTRSHQHRSLNVWSASLFVVVCLCQNHCPGKTLSEEITLQRAATPSWRTIFASPSIAFVYPLRFSGGSLPSACILTCFEQQQQQQSEKKKKKRGKLNQINLSRRVNSQMERTSTTSAGDPTSAPPAPASMLPVIFQSSEGLDFPV